MNAEAEDEAESQISEAEAEAKASLSGLEAEASLESHNTGTYIALASC